MRELPQFFASRDSAYKLDPSFEKTDPSAQLENVEIFEKLKLLRNAHLLAAGQDLYYIAMESREVHLTSLGQFYWQLAQQGRI